MFLGEENKALVRLFHEEFWNKGTWQQPMS